MRACYIRTSFKTGYGLRRGGFVGPSIRKTTFCGFGIHKTGINAGKIYKKYK